MMRRLMLAGAAASALLAAAAPASAADLAVRPPPAPYVAPVPVFTWSGFYLGGNAGAAWRSDDNWFDNWAGIPGVTFPNGSFACASGNCDSRTVFTGGGQVGFNWQFNQFVFGLEGDVNYLGPRNGNNWSGWSAGTTAFSFNGVPYSVSGNWDDGDSNWFATARARGGVAFDRFLVYATGGAVFQSAPGGGTATITNLNTGSSVSFTGPGGNNVGWAAGAGIEYAMTNNISIGLEYLHLGFGSHDVVDPVSSIVSGVGTTVSVNDDVDLVRAKLNVKFNSPFGP